MENNERDRKLDQWLDEALSQYSAAEPRLGLEQRVVANVRAEEQARAGRRTWWRWMPAFATIAAVLIVMVAVKPYWEKKTSRSVVERETSAASENKRAQETNTDAMPAAVQTPNQGQPESRSSISAKKLSAANESENLPAKQKAAVQNARESFLSTRIVEDSAVTKDVQRARPGKQEVISKQMEARQETKIIPSGAGTGASEGVMPFAKVAGTPRPAAPVRANAPMMQTLQVQSAAASSPAERGVTDAGRLPAPTEGSEQIRTVQMKQAADASAAANTMEVMGVMLRTDAITSHATRGQQFPTPVPLSKQEKLMLAASKELQEKPAASDKKKDEITPIELKRIDIEPLPGPEK